MMAQRKLKKGTIVEAEFKCGFTDGKTTLEK